MPLYEYRCRRCGHQFEVFQRVGENGLGLQCPACNEPSPEREHSTFASTGSGTSCSPRGRFT